jgi:hypothetical protein
MRVVHKRGLARKGGKSRKRTKLKDYTDAKTKAVVEVMRNLEAEARQVEMAAVRQVLEKHLGRELTHDDVPRIGRIAMKAGYVLTYDLKPLGEVERFHATNVDAEDNFKVVFTPYEDERTAATT